MEKIGEKRKDDFREEEAGMTTERSGEEGMISGEKKGKGAEGKKDVKDGNAEG